MMIVVGMPTHEATPADSSTRVIVSDAAQVT
jgi:hypothetical protein